VLTNVTSATFDAIEPLAKRAGILLVYTPVNEGGETSTRLFRLGERPGSQLQASVPTLMKTAGGRRWYLAGNDSVWPRATNRVAERVISRQGGRIVGERYERLGSRDFTPVLEDIAGSGAELVISTFVGADEAHFERQFFEAGLRDCTRTLALALDESTRQHIGDEAACGLWTAFGYFEQLPTRSNRAFLDRYRERYGWIAPPVSSISESVYEAVHLYAAAASERGGEDPQETGRRLCGRTFDGPRGKVKVAEPGRLDQSMYLAEAVPGGFAVRQASA
jgi:branched-chain amino acid transport system substrate-binding protein